MIQVYRRFQLKIKMQEIETTKMVGTIDEKNRELVSIALNLGQKKLLISQFEESVKNINNSSDNLKIEEFLNEINEKEANQNESFQKEKFEKIKPDRSKYIVLALVLIALIVASIFFMNPKVTLEQLVGMDISDAKTWALNNDVQLIQKDIYAPMESGTILTQSIEAGNEI